MSGLSFLSDLIEQGKMEQEGVEEKKVELTIFDRNKHFTFGEGDETSQYRGRTKMEKMQSANVAYGQLKCFLEVLQFLNLYYDPNMHENAQVLYIGAALGTNIGVLANMYPMVQWHLYDKSKFNERVLKAKNIFLHKKNFDDEEEDKWIDIAKRDAVFLVSDIRNTAYDPSTKNIESNKINSLKNEQMVWDDMQLQAKWVKAIQPTQALLKIRFPYYFPYVTKVEYEYLKGTIYRQAWQRPTSSETRFVPSQPDDKGVYPAAIYNIKAYENVCFHHNMFTRQKLVFTNPFAANNPDIKPNDKIAETIGLNNDFDSTLTTVIICDYLLKFGVNPTFSGFKSLAKRIFEGVGDGMIWKYNLYGSRNITGDNSSKFRKEDGSFLKQTKEGEKEEDLEQVIYPPGVEAE